MSVQKVSLMNNVSFRGETAKEAQAAPKTPDEIKDGKKKLALALGGLAAVGVGAVLLMRNRKVPSEISIEEFKKIGKFDKGVAKAKNKLFTGIINVPLENGKYAIEYEKGILKQSTKFEEFRFPEETGIKDTLLNPVLKKVYSNNDNVNTVEIFRRNNLPTPEDIKTNEWVGIGKTMIEDGKVTRESYGITGDILKSVTKKLENGTIEQTSQRIIYKKEDKTPRLYHIVTEDANTGKAVSDEMKELPDVPKAVREQTKKNPASEEVFKL